MLKIYKHKDGKLHYHEAWHADGQIIEHWGTVGEQGRTREHKVPRGADEDEGIERILQAAADDGFAPIPIEEHIPLVIEHRTTGADGFASQAELSKRHALQSRMDETLGWTGLGHCDGGSHGMGVMETCCLVVDFEVAKRVIESDLKGTEFGDYIRIYREDEEV